jgi:uncharacterized protein
MTNIIQASTRDPEAPATPPSFPRILPSILWIVVYFALQVAITAVLIAAFITAEKLADPSMAINAETATKNPALIIWGLVASGLVQLGLMWLYLRKGGRAAAIGLDHFGRLKFGMTAVIAIGTLVLATTFNALYANYVISGMPMQDEMAKLLASIPRTPVNITLGIFAIAVVAPLIEELLFRGLLQNALMHHVPAWAAIILSAFTFAVVHMQPLAMPALMALGAAFGYIYYKTGSLRMTIILHMINNALALALTQSLN